MALGERVGDGDDGESMGHRAPLAGIRVVELASVIFGPLAGQILGDLGASVIKVEGPQTDASRLMTTGPHPDLSGVALNLHRNKTSLYLDIKRPGGREVFERLLGDSDVLITNIRPASLDALGLAPADVIHRFPRLIYCVARGYAGDGPDRERAAVDDTIQAEAGVVDAADRAGLGPSFAPTILADKVGALTVVQGALAALLSREATGRGQVVEIPMFDAVLSFMLAEHIGAAAVPGGQPGHTRILTEERAPQRTLDGYIAITPYTDRHWRAIFAEAGVEEEADREEFRSMANRHRNSALVYGRLRQVISTRRTEDWIDACERLDIPYGRVNRFDELLQDPSRHRGVLQPARHSRFGDYLSIGVPMHFSDSTVGLRHQAPLVGEHSRDVLVELGYTASAIDSLFQTGTVRGSS